MRLPLQSPVLVTARIEGKNGMVRELTSLIDFNSPWCVIQSQDGVDLGYPEAVNRPAQWWRVHPDKVPRFLTMRGIERGILLTLRSVSVGRLVAENVDAMVLEMPIPRFNPYEVILGTTFLENFKVTMDMKRKYLSLLPSR